jgi:cellulose synthase/poly-beta-1,6-N-acetylglucosamine synthase-like glycosyltransferase
MLVMSASMFVFLVFVNRYILGTFLRRTRREQFESSGASYEPQVTVVVPMYNEGSGISDTILILLR